MEWQFSPARLAKAKSPVGAVSLQVSGPCGTAIDVMQTDIPKLPVGMAVDGAMLMRIRLAIPATRELPLQVRVTVGQDGDPESGEWLESMSFSNDDGVLHIAMRDREWFDAKGIAAEYLKYERQGFEQIISEAPTGSAFYISVVWRLHGDAAVVDDLSTWFAVDYALPI